MRPSDLPGFVRGLGASAGRLPQAAEQLVAKEALNGIPRGVSMRLERSASGARVVFSGPGARAHAARVRRRLEAARTGLVRGVR
jgi:hypothetical protein